MFFDLIPDNVSDAGFVEIPIFTDSPFIKAHDFEKFDVTKTRLWVRERWYYSLIASCLYILVIFGGQRLMVNRKPFNLKNPLILWNTLLAIFSIYGFLRVYPELIYMLQNFGVFRTFCYRENHNAATAFWGFVFMLSKFVEFGDTIFIVLRKKQLIFLHWYHHITVLNYSWIFYSEYEPPMRVFGSVNFFIHFLMYSYFALSIYGIKIPKRLAMSITILQMTQMMVGIVVNLYSLYVKLNGSYCASGFQSISFLLVMYASYLVLFAKYFRDAYLVERAIKSNNNNYTHLRSDRKKVK